MNRGFLLLLAAVVAIALAVGAILAALTAPSAPAAQNTGALRTTAAPGQPGAAAAGSAQGVRISGPGDTTGQGAPGGAQGLRTTGTISSVEGDTITMSTPQGDVKVKAAEARIQKTVDGTVADLATGQRITVQGQRGEDGSLSATAIQIVPEGERGPQQGGEQGRESGRGPMVRPTAAAQ